MNARRALGTPEAGKAGFRCLRQALADVGSWAASGSATHTAQTALRMCETAARLAQHAPRFMGHLAGVAPRGLTRSLPRVPNPATYSTVAAPGAAASAAAAAATAEVTSGLMSAPEGRQQLVTLLRGHVSNYYQLSKTKLSLLVVATSAAGFVAGSGESVDWAHCAWSSLGTFLAAASANTLNQVYEVRNDALMKRTMRRPLPGGRISRAHALAWAAVTGVGGVTILLHSSSSSKAAAPSEQDAESREESKRHTALPAALAASNILLYAGVYTPLKQLSVLNTWVGAVVGAIPPLIGWTAATGEGLWDVQRSAGAWIWGGVLFLWQLPHFFALSWLCKEDYARGGYKMLSLADPTGRRTANAALRNSALLLPLGPLTTALGLTTVPFAVEASILSAGLTAAAVPFHKNPSSPTARALFRASLLYLPAYMGSMALHRVPHGQQQPMAFAQRFLQELQSPQSTLGDDAAELSAEGELVEVERRRRMEQRRKLSLSQNEASRGPHTLPPAAYASAAPFPFLPLPQ